MPASNLDAAISQIYLQLAELLGEEKARINLQDAINTSLSRVLGGKRSNAARGRPKQATAMAVGPKKAKVTGGGKRGPVPGGRQLKAHLGAEAFDALDPAVKDKARKAISKSSEWGGLTAADRDALLAPILSAKTAK